MPPPSFTVVVPAFNAARTLAEAIESLLAQTFPPEQVVVIDDGSTDRTGEIAGAFGPPVQVISQANGGTAAARNRGLEAATGDVIAFLDADDLYEPARLEQIAAKFVAEPELEAVATDAAIEWPDRRALVSSWWPSGASRDRLDGSAPIWVCTLALRRGLVESLGGFDTRFQIVEDLEYWHRISSRRHVVGYVEEPSYRHRVHPASKTATRSSVRGHSEFVAVYFRYAFARRTPMRVRARLVVRGVRHLRSALVAAIRRR